MHLFKGFFVVFLVLIIPDGVHTESLLGNIHPCNTSQLLITEAVDLHKAQLVIAKCEPLIAEIRGTNGVGVTATGRGGVNEELALDFAGRPELKCCNVSGNIEVVGPRGCEEVLAAASGEGHITAVLVARG